MKLYEIGTLIVIMTAVVMVTALFQADKDTQCGAGACVWCKNIHYDCAEK